MKTPNNHLLRLCSGARLLTHQNHLELLLKILIFQSQSRATERDCLNTRIGNLVYKHAR